MVAFANRGSNIKPIYLSVFDVYCLMCLFCCTCGYVVDVFIRLDSSQYQGVEGDILLVEVLRGGATNAMTSVGKTFL